MDGAGAPLKTHNLLVDRINNITSDNDTSVSYLASNTTKTFVTNLYNTENTNSVYKVIITKKVNNDVKYNFSCLKLGQLICKISDKKDIIDIKKVGKNKVIVQCATASLANKFVTDSTLKKHEYEAYIPYFWTTKAAIIKGVDLDVSEEDLLSNIECAPFKVKRVQRLNRKTSEDNNIKYVPCTTIKVFFDGLTLPEYVYIWRVRKTCEPYILPSIQCHNCLRYGHSSKFCRSKFTICKFCGNNDHKDNECKAESHYCFNCKGAHQAMDINCPEREKQRKIKEVMAQHNLSFQEARLEIDGNGNKDYLYSVRTENRFDLFNNFNNNFPTIEIDNNTKYNIPAYKPKPLTRRNNKKTTTIHNNKPPTHVQTDKHYNTNKDRDSVSAVTKKRRMDLITNTPSDNVELLNEMLKKVNTLIERSSCSNDTNTNKSNQHIENKSQYCSSSATNRETLHEIDNYTSKTKERYNLRSNSQNRTDKIQGSTL